MKKYVLKWSKIKQNLEGFLCPELAGRVKYCATGYRYKQDKPGRCYITVDQKEVLNLSTETAKRMWFESEQEIRRSAATSIAISQEDLEALRKEMGELVPDERLKVIARDRKTAVYAKDMIAAQEALCKSNFYAEANLFLSESIENSLESKDILLNIFALVDRRVGKKRLLNLSEKMKLKHPMVQYFYQLRCGSR